MSKKAFLLNIIDTLEQSGGLPADLEAKLEQARQELITKSESEVEKETTSVTSFPRGLDYHYAESAWISALLYNIVREMEHIVKEREASHPELVQAYHMLCGELGMDTDPLYPSS